MNTIKILKRLTAVAAGATMLGATIMGAAAADLSNYPDSFVSDGVFDGYFVVGESASSMDNLAMTDIATNMWYTAEGETTTTTLNGDSWLVTTSSNYLELSENIASIANYIGDDEMDALADGEISNSKGTASYEQFLYFDEANGTVTYQEDDDDNIGFFYKIDNSDVIARYYLDFGDSLESDITSGSLDDIDDEIITLFGEEYTIVTAENTSNGVKLTLMGGSAADTLSEGESQTYDINGVEYEVELTFTDGTDAQFSINGETTSKLADGETDVLEDGTTIGVTSISYQSYAGGIHTATFFVGADKMVLEHGQSLSVNEESISEAIVTITSSEASLDISIDDIGVNMTADDDYYVGVGDKLSENAELDEPQVLFTQNWDIELVGVDVDFVEEASLTFSEGDDQADLKLELYDGEASISLIYQNETALDVVYSGEDDDSRLILEANSTITDEDYFFLNTADTTSSTADAKSYFLQYKGADDVNESSPKVNIKNVITGETYERSLTVLSHNATTFDLKLGGLTFNFNATTGGQDDDFAIRLTDAATGYSYTDASHDARLSLRTADNNKVTLVQNLNNETAGDWNVEYVVDDADKFDDSDVTSYLVMNATITGQSTGELSTSAGEMTASQLVDSSDSDISYYRSNFGESLVTTDADSSPTKYELSLPSTQAEVQLYITSGATTSTSSSDGTLTQVQIVDATKLDSEVSSLSAQNLIVVGGPCVNTVAADLLGNPSDCTEGFTPGVARVKMVDNGDYMAMLVAGYSGDDTRLAGQVLSHNYENGGLSGEEVEIEGTTYSDATVSEPTEEVVEEVVVEEEATEEVVAEE
ncbi:hypothetical protein HN385_01150 [archaeon]|jgi:hypothetical protein|nr:hypothetical protein [archaeon]MBT3451150.1 hypothetical protein [archaeon]MBT6869301.1 hypothetical protein [archaeon]MBT7192464.1 hypothetical protein [archaeon]MBT7380540.1 hypothetical protein [archaeon]